MLGVNTQAHHLQSHASTDHLAAGYIPASIKSSADVLGFKYSLSVSSASAAQRCHDLLRRNHGTRVAAAVVVLDINHAHQSHPCMRADLHRVPMKRHQIAMMLKKKVHFLSPFEMLQAAFFNADVVNMMMFFAILLFVFAHLVWWAEHESDKTNDQFPQNYWDGIDDACWWGIVTATTVRYSACKTLSADSHCRAPLPPAPRICNTPLPAPGWLW